MSQVTCDIGAACGTDEAVETVSACLPPVQPDIVSATPARVQRIQRIREELAAGTYPVQAHLEAVLERLWAVLSR